MTKNKITSKQASASSAVQVEAAAREQDALEQAAQFDRAISYFNSGEFDKAIKHFREASSGPNTVMGHSARLHIRMCEQRLERRQQAPQTAEEHYNLGVALLNQGKPSAAEPYLLRGAELAPLADHLHYILALCIGIQGRYDDAASHLKRAIELQPRNRALALNDPDFAGLVDKPAINRLLQAGPTQARRA